MKISNSKQIKIRVDFLKIKWSFMFENSLKITQINQKVTSFQKFWRFYPIYFSKFWKVY